MNGNALLKSLAGSWPGQPARDVPAWFRERQRRALDAALTADWPSRSMESWKYTSLHDLAQRSLSPAPDEGGRADGSPLAGPGLVFRDGRVTGDDNRDGLADGVLLEPLSEALRGDEESLRFAIGREGEGGDVFDRLNAAFASDGAWLRAGGGVDEARWLTLRALASPGRQNAAWHLSHRIDIGEGARLRVHVDLDHDPGASGLATLMTTIRVQRGAQLDLAWTATSAGALAAIARTRIDLDQDATLRMHVLDGGAAPSRHDLRIALRGERSRAQLGGVVLVDGRRLVDVQLDLRHETPNARSETVWRAMAGDRGRAVFNGQITVAAGADGTDARLGCKNLLTSATAEIDARPVLEIHADDVKCAHGATVGQLDTEALFYLRTRGLDEATARTLLTRAFAVEALTGIDDSPAAAALQTWLGTTAQ